MDESHKADKGRSEHPEPVTVEVRGHLAFYLSGEYRDGARARLCLRSGITFDRLLHVLGIPKIESCEVFVNGAAAKDHRAVSEPGDHIVISPKAHPRETGF